jgi:cephalosporin-C deacetylase
VAQTDLPLDQLEQYRPPREERDDFDVFWRDTLAEARAAGGPPRFREVDCGLPETVVEDVELSGYAGDPVRGWFIRPRYASAPLACVVRYLGYNSGRGLPHQWTMLPAAGYAVLVMDTRGQGSAEYVGATPDPHGSAPHVAGRLSHGLADHRTHYYRRVFTDAALAVDAARAHPAVDPARVVVAGASQGGGIALAAAGLSDGLAGALVDVPFLCHYRRAVQVSDAHPYRELAVYLTTRRGAEEDVFRALSYVDGVNFAARADAPALFSVGLADEVCPPSTVYAAFHHYRGPKRIEVYPYNGHEGGGPHHQVEQLRFLADRFARPGSHRGTPGLAGASPAPRPSATGDVRRGPS